jgi:hypothetical protein
MRRRGGPGTASATGIRPFELACIIRIESSGADIIPHSFGASRLRDVLVKGAGVLAATQYTSLMDYQYHEQARWVYNRCRFRSQEEIAIHSTS